MHPKSQGIDKSEWTEKGYEYVYTDKLFSHIH